LIGGGITIILFGIMSRGILVVEIYFQWMGSFSVILLITRPLSGAEVNNYKIFPYIFLLRRISWWQS
jgi:hypothetical protein